MKQGKVAAVAPAGTGKADGKNMQKVCRKLHKTDVVMQNGLSEPEAAFVSELAVSGDLKRALKAHNDCIKTAYSYKPLCNPSSLLARFQVQEALHEARAAILKTEGASVGVRTLIDLCKPGTPAGTRLGAASKLVDLGGHGRGGDEGPGKPLAAMRSDELEALIRSIDQALAKEGKAAITKG